MKAKRIPTKIDKKIGAAIRFHRDSQKLTRGMLSSKVKISWQQIREYESGAHQITINRLWDFSQALGVHPLELLPDLITKIKN